MHNAENIDFEPPTEATSERYIAVDVGQANEENKIYVLL
jgi:hypothetical protein